MCVIAIAFYVGAASYGYPRGIKTAKKYYTDYYIPSFCKCIEPSDVSGVDWYKNFSYTIQLPSSEHLDQTN